MHCEFCASMCESNQHQTQVVRIESICKLCCESAPLSLRVRNMHAYLAGAWYQVYSHVDDDDNHATARRVTLRTFIRAYTRRIGCIPMRTSCTLARDVHNLKLSLRCARASLILFPCAIQRTHTHACFIYATFFFSRLFLSSHSLVLY